MEGRKGDLEARQVTLTCENINQHDAQFGGPSYAGNQSVPANQAGLNIMGNWPSDARPKSCGLVLAMVAVFCCFPGISMIVSIGSNGLNNQTLTGIILMSVAFLFAVAAAVLCLRRPHKMKSLRHQHDSLSMAGSKALLTSRDECCYIGDAFRSRTVEDEALCECDEVNLAEKISESVTLSRYFAEIDNPKGPFDLDHEAMEKETERSMRCACYAMADPPCKLGKQNLPPENASTDSAIFMDSDTPSIEALIVV